MSSRLTGKAIEELLSWLSGLKGDFLRGIKFYKLFVSVVTEVLQLALHVLGLIVQ